MSKVKKTSKLSDNDFAYRTVIRSAILCGIFLVISFLLNGEYVKIYSGNNEIFIILDALSKVIIILLFFIFSTLSIGNYKELSGKPLSFREILLLCAFTLLQAFRNPLVFVFTCFGLVILLIYFYLSQER